MREKEECGRIAPPGLGGDLRRAARRPFKVRLRQDASVSAPLGMVAWPAGHRRGVKSCPICQRVEADHLPPAGLLYPLPVPRLHAASASTRCIILDFIELHVARSGHDFLQVHISLPTEQVWLVLAS